MSQTEYSDDFKSFDGELIAQDEIEDGIAHYNLFDIDTEPRKKMNL